MLLCDLCARFRRYWLAEDGVQAFTVDVPFGNKFRPVLGNFKKVDNVLLLAYVVLDLTGAPGLRSDLARIRTIYAIPFHLVISIRKGSVSACLECRVFFSRYRRFVHL